MLKYAMFDRSSDSENPVAVGIHDYRPVQMSSNITLFSRSADHGCRCTYPPMLADAENKI